MDSVWLRRGSHRPSWTSPCGSNQRPPGTAGPGNHECARRVGYETPEWAMGSERSEKSIFKHSSLNPVYVSHG